MATPNVKSAAGTKPDLAPGISALFDAEHSSLDVASRACTSLVGNIVQAQSELFRFLSDRFAKDARLFAQIAECRTPADLAQLQLKIGSDAIADYFAEMKRLTGLFGQAAKESLAQTP